MVRTDDEFPWIVVATFFSSGDHKQSVAKVYYFIICDESLQAEGNPKSLGNDFSEIHLHEDTRLIKLAKKQKSYENLRKDHWIIFFDISDSVTVFCSNL